MALAWHWRVIWQLPFTLQELRSSGGSVLGTEPTEEALFHSLSLTAAL